MALVHYVFVVVRSRIAGSLIRWRLVDLVSEAVLERDIGPDLLHTCQWLAQGGKRMRLGQIWPSWGISLRLRLSRLFSPANCFFDCFFGGCMDGHRLFALYLSTTQKKFSSLDLRNPPTNPRVVQQKGVCERFLDLGGC